MLQFTLICARSRKRWPHACVLPPTARKPDAIYHNMAPSVIWVSFESSATSSRSSLRITLLLLSGLPPMPMVRLCAHRVDVCRARATRLAIQRQVISLPLSQTLKTGTATEQEPLYACRQN